MQPLLVCERADTRWDGLTDNLRIWQLACDQNKMQRFNNSFIGAYEGKRWSLPNDDILKSYGSIWFRDPPFGIMGNDKGHKARLELGQKVYRLDREIGSLVVVAGDIL